MASTWAITDALPNAGDHRALVRTVGWPEEAAPADPVRWSRPVLRAVHAALADPETAIDTSTLRLVRARIDLPDRTHSDHYANSLDHHAPPLDGPDAPGVAGAGAVVATVEISRRSSVGDLVALDLAASVTTTGDTPRATAEVSVLAAGTASAPAGRPEPSRAPEPPPGPALALAPIRAEAATDGAPGFAEWSHDVTAIHTDRAAAQAQGFPERVVPGFYLLALLAAAATRHSGLTVASMGGRFTHPVLVGQRLDLHGDPHADAPRITMRATGPDGPVIRHGWVDLRR